jgi:serine/threonine protein phosphatase PrpC
MLTATVAISQDNSAHGDDNHLVRSLGHHASLDAVMDGVTGRGGAHATQLVVKALTEAPLASADDVVAVLEDVNQRLYRLGRGRFLLTTVAVALCLERTLWVVSLGDSPVYVIRPAAVQHWYSRVPGFLLGAAERPAKLCRAEVELAPGDRVLLATDGLTDNVAPDELVALVRRAASPEAAAEEVRALMASRQAQGVRPEPVGGGFRRDDWTAIFRFFAAAAG